MEVVKALFDSLERQDYGEALHIFSEIEIMVAEDSRCFEHMQQNGWNLDTFYAVFLGSHLIVGDLNGAKYLWNRAPSVLKENKGANIFCSLWDVGKCLWNENVVDALVMLQGFSPWGQSDNDFLKQLIRAFIGALKDRQIRKIALSYSVLNLDLFTQQMCFATNEEVVPVIRSLGWRLDAATNMVYPSAITAAQISSGIVRNKLQENLQNLEQLSRYTAFFEEKPLNTEKLKADTKQEKGGKSGGSSSSSSHVLE